ncbi:MAG: permease, partial [Alphaproteobacteria bacterium]|nr:permease [Alphaproteobacteria bacterium]
AYPFAPAVRPLHDFAYGVAEMLGAMWWGVALGIFFVGLMHKIPKAWFTAILGRGDRTGGIARAVTAGVFLDLCSHGIVLIAAKMYERGASLAQVMAFLVASPWNSLSLTMILIALIGLKWTLVYIAASALVAFVTGVIMMRLVKGGVLPANPHTAPVPEGFSLRAEMKEHLRGFRPTPGFFRDVFRNGMGEARMLLRWLLLGVVIAAAIRAFIPPEIFADWFGPSLIGLLATLVAATGVEVCSEGSVPIASELVNRAAAPGNGFVFLMAGVSTDYTEIMVIREFSKSWKVALFLPLITVPQILVLGWLMNF